MSTNVQTFPGNVEIGGNVSGNGSGLTELNADNITTGTLNSERVPELDTNKITSGDLDYTRLPPTPFLKGGNAYIDNFGSSGDRPFPIAVTINFAFSQQAHPYYNNTNSWKFQVGGLYYIKVSFTNSLYYIRTDTGQPSGGGNGANFKVFLDNQELISTGGTDRGYTSTNDGHFSINKDQVLTFALNVPLTYGSSTLAANEIKFVIYKV